MTRSEAAPNTVHTIRSPTEMPAPLSLSVAWLIA
jgi:hypothetical protein